MKHVSFSVRVGEDFEGRIVDIFQDYARKTDNEQNFLKTAHTDLDYEHGTDVVVDGIPIDITCAFSHKNYMKVLPDVIEVSGEQIRFGIRTGNSRVVFGNPVVVVGIDTDNHFLSTFMSSICDKISKKVVEIMDIVNERYYEYCDENDIEPFDYRKVVFD